jgi:TetR/AcrR family transcriptional regulator, regulator of biofilm formation and stress response
MQFGDGTRAATNAEGRRREILAAAIRVIAQGGADAVTHRRVAAEARVPLGSLTYYFESREDLIREAFHFYIKEASAFLLEVEREIPPTSVADLVDLIVEIMRREFTQPELLRAEYEMILHASRDAQVARAYAGWERGLESRLAAPLEALGAERPLAAARTILHLVRGYELEQLAHHAEEESEFRSRLKSVAEMLVASRAPSVNRKAMYTNESNRARTGEPRRAPDVKHSNHRRDHQ